MRVMIGGGTGFIGSALCKKLSERGDEIIILSRQAKPGYLTWENLKSEGLPPCDAVVNLAGVNIMAKRWTDSFKREIFSSRTDSTLILARAIRESAAPPQVFVTASAIAYYPDGSEQVFDESGQQGGNFLSLVTSQWEKTAQLPSSCPTAQSCIRIGMVLGQGGGVLTHLTPLFRLGLGGRMGASQRILCWIHLDDLVKLIIFCIDHRLRGPINGVSPQSVTSREFAHTLGRVLNKPSRLVVPEWVMKLLLGERATVLLQSPHVFPKRALEAGFLFRFPQLAQALQDIFKDPRSLTCGPNRIDC